jgi:hypothetical protein
MRRQKQRNYGYFFVRLIRRRGMVNKYLRAESPKEEIMIKFVLKFLLTLVRTCNSIASNLTVVALAAFFLSDQYPVKLLVGLLVLVFVLCFVLSCLSKGVENE